MTDHVHREWSDSRSLRWVVGERIGLLVPTEITASQLAGVWDDYDNLRGVRLTIVLALAQDDHRYFCRTLKFAAVTEADLTEAPELVDQGATDTFDVDTIIVERVGKGLNQLRRYAVEGVGDVVLISDGEARETTIDDPRLKDVERTALLFWRARLTFGHPNVLIASYFGSNPAAAAKRLSRARDEGYVPPADHRGQRKARP